MLWGGRSAGKREEGREGCAAPQSLNLSAPDTCEGQVHAYPSCDGRSNAKSRLSQLWHGLEKQKHLCCSFTQLVADFNVFLFHMYLKHTW